MNLLTLIGIDRGGRLTIDVNGHARIRLKAKATGAIFLALSAAGLRRGDVFGVDVPRKMSVRPSYFGPSNRTQFHCSIDADILTIDPEGPRNGNRAQQNDDFIRALVKDVIESLQDAQP